MDFSIWDCQAFGKLIQRGQSEADQVCGESDEHPGPEIYPVSLTPRMPSAEMRDLQRFCFLIHFLVQEPTLTSVIGSAADCFIVSS